MKFPPTFLTILTSLTSLKLSQKGLIKFTKKSLIFSLILLITLPSLISLFLLFPKTAEAAWYDDNWGFRERLPISTHTAAETNVYNPISVDTATLTTDKLQADCDDLRFTKENGELLPYQIVSGCDSATTVINVGFDTMPVAPFNIYMYYGNPSAMAGSSTLTHSACGNGCAEGAFATEEKAQSPIAYWKFDDATGTTAQDATTTNADATLTGSPLPTWQTEDQCISGKCLYFGGSTSRDTVATSIAGLQTIAFWVRPTSVTTVGLIDFDGGTHKISVSSGTISATGFTSPTIYVNGVVSSTLVTNRWQFVEVTTGTGFTGSAIKLAFDNTNYLTGFLDEVKIYSYARSAAQIQADFNARNGNEGVGARFGVDPNNAYKALNDGLVGYWKMDESSWTVDCSTTSVLDSSGNANNGKSCPNSTGPTGGAVGKFGNSGSFDNSDDYVDVGSPSVLDNLPSTKISVAVWIKPSTTLGSNVIIAKESGATDGWYLAASGNSLQFTVDTDSTNGSVSNSFTDTTNWTHVVATYDNSGDRTPKLFVNGIQVGSGTPATGTVTDESTRDLHVGDRGTTDYYSGLIDEARVYNRALSAAEISQLYNFAPGPVGYWKMDEGSGSTAIDSSGNGYTGTLNSSPAWANGKYGGALNFTRTSSQYVGAGDDFITSYPFTMGAWVKTSETANAKVIFSISDASSNSINYYIRIRETTGVVQAIAQNTASGTAGTATAFHDGNWHYITGVFESDTSRKIYVDGVLHATDTTSVTFSNNATNRWSIGRFGQSAPSGYFDGLIDDVKVYNYARTAAQIVEDMNASHPAPGSPVGSATGYWKFDEGADNRCSGLVNDACNSGSAGTALDGGLSASSRTTSGKFGKAFDGGDNKRTTISDNAALDFTGSEDFSISFWFKSDSATNPSANEYLVEKSGNIATDAVGYAIYTTAASDGLICFGIDDDTTAFPEDETCSAADIYDNSWHYLVAKKTGTSRLDLYVDGKPNGTADTTISATGTLVNGLNFYIGDTNATDGTDEFLGDMDEVKVYRVGLTDAQVQADMNRGQAQVLGALGNYSGYEKNSINQEYCVPGGSECDGSDGPVGRWDLEEGSSTTAIDSSGNGNSGTITAGSGSYVTGKFGFGYNFDGNATLINNGAATTLDNLPAAGMTIEAWIYPKTTGEGGAGFIMAKSVGTTPANTGWIFGISGTNALTFQVDGSTNLVATTNSNAITLNRWNHVAVSWDGVMTTATSVNVYVNGIEQTYATQTNGAARVDDGAFAFYIGNSSNAAAGFDGVIDGVRAFNYNRSAAQIAWDYNKGLPIAHWRMDECQGTTINDSSGNGNTGTLTIGASGGNTAVGTCTTSGAWFDGATGKRNYSMDFDGTDDYITTTDAFYSNQVTISAWIKGSTWSSTGGKYVVSKRLSSNPGDEWALVVNSDGTVNLYAWNGSGSTVVNIVTTQVLSVDTWYHLAGTMDGTNAKIYINGVLAISGSQSSTINDSSSKIMIGRCHETDDCLNGSTRYVQGQIDDVKLFNYGLTATQVQTLYNEGTARFGPTTGAP